MRKLLSFIIISLFINLGIMAQNLNTQVRNLIQSNHQVTVKFTEKDQTKVRKISKLISIDGYTNGVITADISQLQIDHFLDLGYNYSIIYKNRALNALNVATTVSQMSNWDKYPSYSVYVQMMQDFASNHSTICKLDTIGTSQNGHLILVLKITDNPNIDENEAEFFYTGQMHGDEIVAGVMFLHLIDYLLNNYETNSEITNLLNNIELWINPIANPDGMYNGGDENVSNSSRYLANGVDPNRNFPNPVDGDHSDGEPWASETIDMMNFANAHNFVMSCNTHSGAEVANYPWDSWTSTEKLTADDNWWQFIAKEYADLAQANSPSSPPSHPSSEYFTDVNASGFINGGDWYVVTGSRQDYMNYYKNCRELTVELSSTKLLDSDYLPDYWDYNRAAFISYLKQVQYGINGIITDACTGLPIKAKIEIENHDVDNSFVYSTLPVGDYHRPIYEGTYNVIISAPGYESQTFTNISVANYNTTTVNASLTPLAPIADFSYEITNPCLGTYFLNNRTEGNQTYTWTFPDGTQTTSTDAQITFIENGNYTIQLTATNTCTGDNSTNQTINVSHLISIPNTADIERCGNGDVTFSATANGSGNISWYDSENGNLLQTGNNYTTNINNTTTLWVEETGLLSTVYGGKYDNSGTGDFYTYNTEHGLIFDCNQEVVLKSVKVFANGAGNRTIKLVDENSNTLFQQIFNIPDGESRINLNWNIPIGNNFYLYGPSSPNLYRNGGNGAPNLPYPYNIDNKISITGNTAGSETYYYYFYDWELETQACSSPQIPVTATVNPLPIANYTYSQEGAEINFTNTSSYGTTYSWNFGDGSSSNMGNPTHSYTANGDYLVSLSVTNNCGTINYSETISIISLNINFVTHTSFNIYPNPTSNFITISNINTSNNKLEITDITGKIIKEYKLTDSSLLINIENWAKGIYFVKIGNTIQKLIKK